MCTFARRSCCCKSCFDTFRTNTPHRHTGGVRPHMIGPFMQVVPVPISIPMAEFNYAYIIIDLRTGEVVLLDPAEVAEVCLAPCPINTGFQHVPMPSLAVHSLCLPTSHNSIDRFNVF